MGIHMRADGKRLALQEKLESTCDHVLVKCEEGTMSGLGKCSDMAGDYVAVDKERRGQRIFKKDGDDSFQIVNTNCGWHVEKLTPQERHRLARTLARTYSGKCRECTGSCQTEEALDTSKTYDNWGRLQQGISLRRTVCN